MCASRGLAGTAEPGPKDGDVPRGDGVTGAARGSGPRRPQLHLAVLSPLAAEADHPARGGVTVSLLERRALRGGSARLRAVLPLKPVVDRGDIQAKSRVAVRVGRARGAQARPRRRVSVHRRVGHGAVAGRAIRTRVDRRRQGIRRGIRLRGPSVGGARRRGRRATPNEEGEHAKSSNYGDRSEPHGAAGIRFPRWPCQAQWPACGPGLPERHLGTPPVVSFGPNERRRDQRGIRQTKWSRIGARP